jgi:uncharacterized protein (TIGR03437 family)
MRKSERIFALFAAVLGAAAPMASAQSWDPTGNNQLNTTYYFREVIYAVGDQAGDVTDGLALYGGITFNGSGSYSISTSQGVMYDGYSGQVSSFSATGTYTIGANGHGFINWSIPALSVKYTIRVLVSGGIVVGSATDTSQGINEMFVAAPIASPNLTTSAFNGSYALAYMNIPVNNYIDLAYDAMITLSANGSGGIGTANVTGYVGSSGSTAFNVSESNVKYTFSGGAAVVTFPTGNNLPVVGQEYLYFSPDQNFVFGGSPTNTDFIVGVRTGSAPNLGGLYYQSGLDVDESTLSSGYATTDSYYGSFSASNGIIVSHQRLQSVFNSSPYDYSVADSYSTSAGSAGAYTDTGASFKYVIGNGGVRVGYGLGPYLGVNVAIPGPAFTPSGVFLSPVGIVNAASSAPFTSGIARGELITLYGANLAASTTVASSLPFPATLAGVQVLINNVPAPVYVVSPGQVSALVPSSITSSVAQIQVVNNNVKSNVVTVYVGMTAPGVFTNPAGGLGNAAALHADYSLVTTSHPAVVGETISVYVTGLGDVFPSVPDGTAGPSSPLSTATSMIGVLIDGVAATTSYVGLAPGLAGLYQINVTIPSGITAGSAAIDISGPDAYSSEAALPVALQ